jgi:uncharacterized glyoxalase superfamily protein PhnB
MYTGRLQVALYVGNVVRSVDYYQRVLGFTFVGFWDAEGLRFVDRWRSTAPPEHAELRAGDNPIVLQPDDGRERRGRAEYVLEVDDLDLVFRRARANGGRVVDPWVHCTGDRMFTLTDPDGHVWRLVQPRPATVPG